MNVEELYKLIEGDYADAKSRLMNDKLISKFVVMYLDDPSYDDLVAAWDAQDGDSIFTASHTLKGVCANLALTAVFTPASQLCEMYRNGARPDNIADAQALMDAIKQANDATVAGIKQFAERG